MNRLLRFPFELFLVIAALIWFQWSNLSLAHFWDEAWVYAPAIRSLADGHLSLLPDALPTGLSRGHPLLYQLLGGAWMKLFDKSNFSAHSFALLISFASLGFVYFLIRRLVSRSAAVAGLLFVVLQPVFIAQSTSLYPETLMTLGLLVALLGYHFNKNWVFVIGICAALYSKESAVVFLIAFLLWDVMLCMFAIASWRALWKYVLPVVVLILHPILLYAYHGWAVFPEHAQLINLEPAAFFHKLNWVLEFAFHNQNRSYWLLPLFILTPMILRLSMRWKVLMTGALALMAAAVKYFSHIPIVCGTLLLLSLVVLCYANVVNAKSFKSDPILRFQALGYIIVFGFVVFSAMNFYTPRYMFSIVVLLCVLSSVAVWSSPILSDRVRVILTLFCASVSFHASWTERGVGEVNLGLYDDLRVQQGMVDWMLQNAERDATVCTNFVTSNYLKNEYSGYVASHDYMSGSFSDICQDCGEAEFVVYTRTNGRCTEVDQQELISKGYEMVYADTLNASYAVVFRKE